MTDLARGPHGELLFVIPAATKPERCKWGECGMTIYWITTKNNKHMPVDCSIANVTRAPIKSDPETHNDGADGIGAAHWGQCKDKDRVRRHTKR